MTYFYTTQIPVPRVMAHITLCPSLTVTLPASPAGPPCPSQSWLSHKSPSKQVDGAVAGGKVMTITKSGKPMVKLIPIRGGKRSRKPGVSERQVKYLKKL
jgi:hypothetical protein